MSVSIHRMANVKQSTSDDSIEDLTKRFTGWVRSIRDVGGYWYGESPYAGTPWEMKQFFNTALFDRVVESDGGGVSWEGEISELTLTYSNGDTLVRSAAFFANRVKVIYSKIFPNLFTNGSAESGAWTPVGTPATHAVDTTWYTNGVQSMHVVTNAAGEGTETQANVAVTAGVSYDIRFDVKIDSGAWTLYAYNTGTTDVVASRAALNTGEQELKLQIPESNTATGIDVQILDSSGSGEIWIDAGDFRIAPVRGTTTWYESASSIARFGERELIISEGGMSDEGARSLAQIELANRQWPKTQGVNQPIHVSARESDHVPDNVVPESLIVSVHGYVKTLDKKYIVSVNGTANTSVHVTSLIGEGSEFITAGKIEENTSPQKIDAIEVPSTLLDSLITMIESGKEGDTTPWMGGVYADRLFHYEKRPTEVTMDREGTGVNAPDGEAIPPWRLKPGLMQYPSTGTSGATGLDQDKLSVVFIREVEYNKADNSAALTPERDKYG